MTYDERKRDASTWLHALLNPRTAKEDSLVDWVCGWDLETIEGLTAMIERGRGIALDPQ